MNIYSDRPVPITTLNEFLVKRTLLPTLVLTTSDLQDWRRRLTKRRSDPSPLDELAPGATFDFKRYLNVPSSNPFWGVSDINLLTWMGILPVGDPALLQTKRLAKAFPDHSSETLQLEEVDLSRVVIDDTPLIIYSVDLGADHLPQLLAARYRVKTRTTKPYFWSAPL